MSNRQGRMCRKIWNTFDFEFFKFTTRIFKSSNNLIYLKMVGIQTTENKKNTLDL